MESHNGKTDIHILRKVGVNIKVLIVDDDLLIAKEMSELVISKRYKVIYRT